VAFPCGVGQDHGAVFVAGEVAAEDGFNAQEMEEVCSDSSAWFRKKKPMSKAVGR
jgi:hypothetical protein